MPKGKGKKTLMTLMPQQDYHYLIVNYLGERIYRDGDVVTDFKRFPRDLHPVGYVIVKNGKLVLRGFGKERTIKNMKEACDIAEPIIFNLKCAYLEELRKRLSPCASGSVAPPDHLYYDQILEDVQSTFDSMEDMRRWWAGEPQLIDGEWYDERAEEDA
jgi:hypothetical protein